MERKDIQRSSLEIRNTDCTICIIITDILYKCARTRHTKACDTRYILEIESGE